jgi:nucleotidyltransferase substrate binding protein (TIGR01987 family)
VVISLYFREPENSLYRDAVIQRFEFTYGLCASMLKRTLARVEATAPENDMSFPALIRTASEYGLLRSGWDKWSEFRRARNLTSHVYDEEVARQVVKVIPAFSLEVEALYANLTRKAADGED